MKKTFTIFCLLTAITAGAQVGIGTETPDSKAALDITATGKGLLIPRMDSATRIAISNPPDGLMVFQLTIGRAFGIQSEAVGYIFPIKQVLVMFSVTILQHSP